MKRLHWHKVDSAAYYERIWGEEHNQRPYYDAVRMRWLAEPWKELNREGLAAKLVDVGAGVFGTAQYILENPEEYGETSPTDVTAIDQSYTAAELVKAKHPDMSYVVKEFEDEIPLPSNHYDLVISGETIEHMEDPQGFVMELVRICRPGGHIRLTTVDTESENAKAHGEYPEHLWAFTPRDLKKFFIRAGCESVEHEKVGDYDAISARK